MRKIYACVRGVLFTGAGLGLGLGSGFRSLVLYGNTTFPFLCTLPPPLLLLLLLVHSPPQPVPPPHLTDTLQWQLLSVREQQQQDKLRAQ